jgi:hypothetical protein
MTKLSNTGFQFINKTGFVSELPTVSAPMINEPIREEVIVREEVLDVPSFIKEAIRQRKLEERKVIHVNFAKQEEPEEEEEREHPVVEVLLDGLSKARKKIVNNPVFKYFIDDYQQTPKKKKEDK